MNRHLSLLLLALAPACVANAQDGTLDPGFADAGRAMIGYLESDKVSLRDVAVAPSGRIWMFSDDEQDVGALYLARLNPDGTPDATFGGGTGQRRTVLPELIAQTQALRVHGAVVQADGKPLVYGALYPVSGEGGVYPGVVCRLAVAGNFDPSFGTGGCRTLRGFIDTHERCHVSDLAVDSLDRIVVTGNCEADTKPEQGFLARITPAGASDMDFAGGAGILLPAPPPGVDQQRFRALVLDEDDLLAVGAEFTTVLVGSQSTRAALRKFDSGGSPMPEFASGGSVQFHFDDEHEQQLWVRDLVMRPDGKLLLLAQSFGGTPARSVALLAQVTASGALDTGFGVGGLRVDEVDAMLGANDALRSLSLDPDGRAVVAGQRERNGGTVSHAGTEFWLTFVINAPFEGTPVLHISGDTATTGVIENAAHGISIPFAVTPGELTVVPVPPGNMNLGVANDTIGNAALKISAQAPVLVTAINGAVAIIDGFAAVPAAQLGREYRVIAGPTGGTDGVPRGSQFAIAATRSNTKVIIVPSATVGARLAGVPYQITLNAGQSYHLWATTQPGLMADLTGTTISANHPVAVVSGHATIRIPDGTDFYDVIYDQQTPISEWGQRFVLTPFALRSSGDVVRVLAHESGTVVSINGVVATTLNAGQSFNIELTGPMRIESSRKVAVAQFLKGLGVEPPDAGIMGDPMQMNVRPISQWQRRYHASTSTFPGDWESMHFLNIIAPLSVTHAVTIDGTALLPAQFSPLGDSGYASVTLTYPVGTYVVQAPEPIGVNVYGYAHASAYGYAAPTAPASGVAGFAGPGSNDLILRFAGDGQRDPVFGQQGIVQVDHTVAFDTAIPSRDRAMRAIATRGDILMGSASINGASGQFLPIAYRLRTPTIFSDGFESPP